MPNMNENHKFAESVLDTNSVLDNAIDWITCNMSIDDVYDKDTLAQWAEENGYVKAED